jgi:hypothetical protein
MALYVGCFQTDDGGNEYAISPENGGTTFNVFELVNTPLRGMWSVAMSTSWMEHTNRSALQDFYSWIIGDIRIGKPQRAKTNRKDNRKRKPKKRY